MLNKLKKWIPHLGFGVWLQALPLLGMFSILWITAQDTLGLLCGTIKFWEYVLYGWAYALTGYWLGIIFCLRYLKSRWLAAAFAWVYLFLYAVNIALLHSAGVVLVHYYLMIAGTTNWLPYFTSDMWLLTIIYVTSGLTATFLIFKNAKPLSEVHVRKLLILLVLLWGVVEASKSNYLHPSRIAANLTGHQQTTGAWQVTQTETLRMVADNPVGIFLKAALTRWDPLQFHPTSELSAMADTIKTWHLPLGDRHYPSLGLKPINHIIVFATESLSLDFMAPYNTNLPPEISPFHASQMVTQAMFLNYKCVSLPTQPGLIVTYNSHPNVRGLFAGNSDLSLIKLLNAEGYETYVLMSCSESFLNNKAFFTKLGFQHVMGLETLQQDPKVRPFIEGWGLMDRALYDVAVNLLAQNPDKKIFIHVCNTDTHGPVPRQDFGPLEYPPIPSVIDELVKNSAGNADDDARAILRGIFRHDYDIGLTFQRLQDRKLLTDDTLVVLTADHNFPPATSLRDIPGYPTSVFHRIPLAFFSGQRLPDVEQNKFCSQLDFAPTIAHLIGAPVPAGWWGESVFATNWTSPYVMRFNDKLSVTINADTPAQSISFSHPADQSQSNLLTLFQGLYIDTGWTNLNSSLHAPNILSDANNPNKN